MELIEEQTLKMTRLCQKCESTLFCDLLSSYVPELRLIYFRSSESGRLFKPDAKETTLSLDVLNMVVSLASGMKALEKYIFSNPMPKRQPDEKTGLSY